MKKQKENQNQERKSSRGITLIALVITNTSRNFNKYAIRR